MMDRAGLFGEKHTNTAGIKLYMATYIKIMLHIN
jgi:hypothetical protein